MGYGSSSLYGQLLEEEARPGLSEEDFTSIAEQAVSEMFGAQRTLRSDLFDEDWGDDVGLSAEEDYGKLHQGKAARPGMTSRGCASAGCRRGGNGFGERFGAWQDAILTAEEEYDTDRYGTHRGHGAQLPARVKARMREHRAPRTSLVHRPAPPLSPIFGTHPQWTPPEAFGQVPEPQRNPFTDSLWTGLGVGLGFLGAVAGVNLVVRAFSGR